MLRHAIRHDEEPAIRQAEQVEMSGANYLGLRDLLARWVYSRQGVYKVLRYRDFPAPAFTINAGKTKVWELADIKAFEKNHPELLSVEARDFKVKGYYLTMSRDRLGLRKRTD